MKFTTAALSLLATTLSLAAPTTTSSTTKLSTRQDPTYTGFFLPSIIKTHNVVTGVNTVASNIITSRFDNTENSTLYQIAIPDSAAGRTCHLVLRANQEVSDIVTGTQALDVFRSSFADLFQLNAGNQRDVQLARMRFDESTGLYAFDKTDFPNPAVESFPCPAGLSVRWETVAVGDLDVNVVRQDSVASGGVVPNGLSVGWW